MVVLARDTYIVDSYAFCIICISRYWIIGFILVELTTTETGHVVSQLTITS